MKRLHSGNAIGAIVGIVLIALALFISAFVAANLPDSWPGAVLAVVAGGVGIALVVSHLRLGHRKQRTS